MTDRGGLRLFFQGPENGSDVVFELGGGSTPGQAAHDALERLNEQGHSDRDGVWFS